MNNRSSQLKDKKIPLWIHSLSAVAALALTALAGLYFIRYALLQPPEFDGGLNLNIARSLAEGTGYGSYYNGFRRFPSETQTNAPYILPASLAFAISGVGVFTSQVVNLIYLVVFSVGLYLVIRRLGETAALALLAVALALQVPGMSQYAMGGYGEIPALSFLFLGLLGLSAALRGGQAIPALWGGIALGVSFLTKTVALIWVVPAAGLFMLLALSRPARWRLPAAIAAGLAIPVILWEFYRMVSLGGFDSYVNWWGGQFYEILSEAGVRSRIRDTPGLLNKGIVHLSSLGEQTAVPGALLAVLWIIPAPFVLLKIARDVAEQRFDRVLIFGTLAGVAAAYLLWWLFITPTAHAWLRRIMNGLLLQQVVTLIVANWLAHGALALMRNRAPASGIGAVSTGGLATALAAIVMLTAVKGQVAFRSPAPPPWAAGVMDMARSLRALPADARYFGYGWWQAPVLALLSGKKIDDLERWLPMEVDAVPEKYLVLDFYVLQIKMPALLNSLRKEYELEPIHQSESGAIYRLSVKTVASGNGQGTD